MKGRIAPAARSAVAKAETRCSAAFVDTSSCVATDFPFRSLAKEVWLHPPIKTSRQVRHFNLNPSHQTFDVPDVLVAKLRPVAKGRYAVPVYGVTLTGWGLCGAWERGW
jgi:hypothetical protein